MPQCLKAGIVWNEKNGASVSFRFIIIWLGMIDLNKIECKMYKMIYRFEYSYRHCAKEILRRLDKAWIKSLLSPFFPFSRSSSKIDFKQSSQDPQRMEAGKRHQQK